MNATYDLVIVGAGSAGLSAATFAARLGARVSLIDRERPGGDCLYSGCVPSKTLMKVAKVAHALRHADRFGLSPSDPKIDLDRVNAHVHATIDRVYQFERPEALKAEGIGFYAGDAHFISPDTVVAGDHTLRGGRILICTGARPTRPRLPGLDRVPYVTYEDVFHLQRIPQRLIILGTGPVGVELAQAFARLGSRVTVLGRSGRVLGKADPAVQVIIEEILRFDGTELRLQFAAERVETTGNGGIVVFGMHDRVEADQRLVALGREPNVAGLDLERGGIRALQHGIAVDASLRTSNRRVYACGDVIGGPQFSHYAAWQSYVAVRNALLPGTTAGIKHHFPWAVFTDPEVATVGLTEPEARVKHGHDVVVRTVELDHVDRAQTENDTRGFIKVVARRNGTILGASRGRARGRNDSGVRSCHGPRFAARSAGQRNPRVSDLRNSQSAARGGLLDRAPRRRPERPTPATLSPTRPSHSRIAVLLDSLDSLQQKRASYPIVRASGDMLPSGALSRWSAVAADGGSRKGSG